MDIKTRRLSCRQKGLLIQADRARAKAERRQVAPFFKVYWARDVALLEAPDQGWVIHSHTPASYGAPQSWLMTSPEA